MNDTPKPNGISRRTLVKGAAWSVPVVAVGPALPAFAFTPPVLEFSGTACKIPGQGQDVNKGYVLGFSINNGNAFEIYINILDFTIIGATSTITPLGIQLENCELIGSNPGGTACWPTGETRIAVYLEENGNSQNAVLQLTYEVRSCVDDSLLQPSTLLEVELSGDPITGGCEPHPGWYTTCPLPMPPMITSVTPTSGTVGDPITITGTDLGSSTFPEYTTVDLTDGTNVYPQAVSFPSVSPTSVMFAIAAGTPAGTYDLVLNSGTGNATFSSITVT